MARKQELEKCLPLEERIRHGDRRRIKLKQRGHDAQRASDRLEMELVGGREVFLAIWEDAKSATQERQTRRSGEALGCQFLDQSLFDRSLAGKEPDMLAERRPVAQSVLCAVRFNHTDSGLVT